MLMVKQDNRTVDVKIKDGFKDAGLRKYIRESIQFKQVKSPKNKTTSTSIKMVTVNVNDTNHLNPDELVKNCLFKVFNEIKTVAGRDGFNRNFPLTQDYLTKNNINLGDGSETLDQWEEVKIKSFVFYYHVSPVMKEVYEYEFKDEEVDLEREVTQEVIDAVHSRGKVRLEKTNMYNVKVIIPLKRLDVNKPKQSKGIK